MRFTELLAHPTSTPRKLALLFLVLAGVVTAPLLASDDEIRVMTRNIYLGGDVGRPLAATNTAQFLAAVAETFAEVQATNFPERAVKLADEIEKSRPSLIGLQEVALWRSQFPPDFSRTPNATVVEVDFLEVLMAELARRNLPYSPVAVGTRADVEVPALSPTGIREYRLTMRDVILRDDAQDLQISNVVDGRFVTNAVIPTFAGPLVFVRGWASADVTIGDQTIRFINTHLEAFAEGIRIAQVTELLSGPANTQLPVILVGDMNSEPESTPYNQLSAAGFEDAALESGNEGRTCCQESDLLNEKSALSVRIDYIFYRGPLSSEDVKLVGHRWKRDRTPSGLWTSDHAGLVGTLTLGELNH